MLLLCFSIFFFFIILIFIIIMTRRKVKMAFIANYSERRRRYIKRTESVLKKTEELSTLCGIEACAIVYSPDDPEPKIWPSDDSGVRKVLRRFRSLNEWQQGKHMVNTESYTAQTIVKKREQVRKLKKINKEEELSMFMFQCIGAGWVQPQNNMSVEDLNTLSKIIDKNLNDISRKMETSTYQPLMQPSSYQPLMEASSSSSQTQLQTQSFQTLMETPAYQPHIPTQPLQTLLETQAYQPQMQAQSYQTLMQPPAFQPQMPTTSYQTLLETPANQPQMPTPALQVANTGEMTMLNDDNASNMTANNMQNQWFMDILNDDEFDPILAPIGEVDLPL